MVTRRFGMLLSLFLTLPLLGCTTEETQQRILQQAEIAADTVAQARVPGDRVRYNPLVVRNDFYAGGQAVRMRRGQALPPQLERARGVTLVSSAALSLPEIMGAISQQTGLPARYEAGAEALAGAGARAPRPSPAPGAPGGEAGGGAAAPAAAGSVPIAYEGPLSGLLDIVGSAFGLSWRFDGSSIVLSRFETRVFVVEALPGEISYSDSVEGSDDSGGGSSGGESGSSSSGSSALEQTSTTTAQINFWGEFKENVAAVLGGVGSFTVSPSSGTVTVVTTPSLMNQVAEYVSQENKRLSQQIAINVEVFTVDLDESENFDANLSTAFSRMEALGLNFAGPATTEVANLSVAVFDPEQIGELTSTFTLLNTIGNTSRVAQFPMTTINNRPVVRRIGRDRAYLAAVELNQSDSFQNITLTPGTIREGFSLQLTPRILPDGRVLLQYSLQLVDLITIREFTSGSSQIQLPETSNRTFAQQSVLRNGTTLILGGFDQEQVGLVTRGVGDPFNYLLGGGTDNRNIRQMLFIAITPQQIDVARGENF